jgi:CRISPR-associated endonuclease/helicase Cas3
MSLHAVNFWAKTIRDERGQEVPGISVRDHCLNVGSVAQTILEKLPNQVKTLLPGDNGSSAAVLAALHDIGKITLGFQIKCPAWAVPSELGDQAIRRAMLSVSDHALVSQVFLQHRLKPSKASLWAAAIGAHHGRPKGRIAKVSGIEVDTEWAEGWRKIVADQLIGIFGPLPDLPPKPDFGSAHSDLWLLAGLVTVADWIGSNEAFFPVDRGLTPRESRQRAEEALSAIGWPGGALRKTSFSEAFTGLESPSFQANSIQESVSKASPGLVIVEAPMGCGKTEASLRLAQQWITEGHHQGFYFALPTQVTSNRIHRRVAEFLNHSLANPAHLRLAHGHSWLEHDSNVTLGSSHSRFDPEKDGDNPLSDLREARSWFQSSKHALLAPYGVGTIDQALQGMVTVKHFFVRRFSLAGKVVILDEIHSYDIYTGTLIGALIRELLNLGCSVIVLSATLTAKRRQELLKAAGCDEPENDTPESYPLITSATCGFPVQHLQPSWSANKSIQLRAEVFSESSVLEELIRRAENGEHVLWIRNTVIESQKSFAALRSQIAEGEVLLGLLHSRFPFARRQELEAEWLDRLGRHRAPTGPGSILIATQVVEQSVDIDLDFIVSDLAPTDMLFQRLGRLWRHDRPGNHRAAVRPEFWVRLPELDLAADAEQLRSDLGRSARVYAPYVLLRSAAVWRGRTEIRLTQDIRPLLEETYSDTREFELAAWEELRNELEAEKRQLQANAEAAMSVFGMPMLDPEEDGALTRRQGAPTVPLVLLLSVVQLPAGQGWVLTVPDGTTVNVSGFEWSIDAARFLHRWIVRVPQWQVPSSTERPRWLSEHAGHDAVLALLEEDGRLRFGDQSGPVSYHPDFGVFADKPTKTRTEPEPWSDDADESDF